MTSSLDLIRGRQVVQTLTNQSGGSVIAGDVVIIDTAHDESFVTTTSAAYSASQVCIALDSIAAAATGRVLLQGYAPLVNVSASATRGYYLFTHTVAKQATSGAAFVTGAFGQVLKAGTTPSAYIFPPALSGTAGITRSGSTTGDHLAVWNGSNADSLKDGGAVGTAGLVRLAQTILVGTATNFDFTTISGAYNTLKIIVQARSDSAQSGQDVHIHFNGDTGNNYDIQISQANNTTVSASVAVAGATNYIGQIPAGSDTANFAGSIEITIPNYSGSTFYKNYIGISGHARATAVSNQYNRVATGQWRNTAAITQVTLLPTANNFIAGSVATLYGLT